MGLKFSVITVSYNSENTIEKTIKSVITQKYPDIEYIIIDGCSTDNTVKIIKKYERRITRWISEPDQGIYDAMNKGISLASGDVVSFLNSDDWYEEDVFEKLENIFTKENCDVVSGSIILWEDNREAREYQFIEEKEQLYTGMIYAHPATFVRKSVFDQCGKFDLKYKIVADYDWFFRVQLSDIKIFRADEKFTNYSLNGISSKESLRQISEEYEIRVKYAALLNTEKRKRISSDIELKMEDAVFGYINRNYETLLLNFKRVIKDNLFGTHKKFSVFGAGIRLKSTIDFLEQLGITIDCIYDNHNAVKEQFGYKIVPFDQYHGEYVIVSTEKYYDEIKEQLRYKRLTEHKDFCNMLALKEKIFKILQKELKNEIQNSKETGDFCF